uniref:Uncharacterized protein n=1 Tax=Anguilla anguilla TaxID=7936 RepID=A0A0E9P7F6_ANGAN
MPADRLSGTWHTNSFTINTKTGLHTSL